MGYMKSNDKTPSVKIKVTTEEIQVETNYQIRYHSKAGGSFICTIPEFNVFYCASSEDEVVKKGDSIMDVFFGHYLENHNKFSLRKLAVNLHRLGFKPMNNPSAMVNMMRNKPDNNTNFKIASVAPPEGFDMSTVIDRTTNFAALA